METKHKFLFILITLVLIACTHVDYQTIEIDNNQKEISIVSSNEFVIDSISINRFDILYFSKSLSNKLKGRSSVSLKENNNDYQVYIDDLSSIDCDTDNLSMDIIIRKKGSKLNVTKDIAMNFKHVDEIQTLRGLIYNHCSQEVKTSETDKRYK